MRVRRAAGGAEVGALARTLVVSLPLLLLHTEAKGTPGPYMRGWTSWDLSAITEHPVYGREWLTASNVLAQSEALAATPALGAAGFVYINIDSFWAADPTQVVDEWGRWTHNTTRFPQGMRAIADAVHARGQKLGLYLNPGVAVAAAKQATPVRNGTGGCTGADIAVKPFTGGNTFWDAYKMNYSHPCALPYVQSLADLIAIEYGADLLKIDAVSPGSDTDAYDSREDIAMWSAALEATGKDVWLTISWAIDPAYASDFAPHANAARVADDVVCYCPTYVEWMSVVRLFNLTRPWLNSTGAGPLLVYPDLDSLDVCGGALDGLTLDEKRTAATFWAIVQAPLFTGNDLTALDPAGLALLLHPDVLAINAAGVPAFPTPTSNSSTGPQVWATDYANGTFTLALFNLDDAPRAVTGLFADFAGHRAGLTFAVRDVWAGQDLGTATVAWTTPVLPAHGVQLLRLDAAATV
jgi:alpha-galactosidase